MIAWIMICVTPVRYSFLINGRLSSKMEAKRGLRQGDPMSPYLFVLSKEYLDRCLSTLQENPEFNYHLRCQKLGITHLSFADDLLLFTRGDVKSVQILKNKFLMFSEPSGLKVNLNKSQIILEGCLRILKKTSYRTLDTKRESFPSNT